MKRNLLGISLLTMTCLYGMLCAVVFLGCIFAKVPLDYTILVSIIIFILQFLLAPFFTDLSMKWFYKATFDYPLPDYLNKFIAEICAQNGMKFPKIGFINDGAPNAFTYGRTKNDARIVLTRGIFEILDEEEVKAVVGHELGHVVHYDMLFMTVAQLVPLVLYYIFEVFTKSNNDKDDNRLAIVGLVAYVLYIVSQYIILWLSRVREYYADSYAMDVTKNPTALGNALVKIGYGLTTRSSKDAKMSASKSNALGIFDAKTSKSLIVSSYDDGEISKENIQKAMKWEMWNVWAKWYEFLSTHPLISKRLIAISDRCSEFGQRKYIEFNEEKTESYVDDFFLELLISFAPFICCIVSVSGFVLAPFFDSAILVGLIALPLTFGCSLIKFLRRYRKDGCRPYTVQELLGEVKVSDITAIPCEVTGKIIGRGDPGCMFSEDFVINDSTGIVFVDHKSIFGITDLFVALTRTGNYIDKNVRVKGWYRRSPVPYIEILEYEVEGQKKKVMKSYYVGLVVHILFLIITSLPILLSLLAIFY